MDSFSPRYSVLAGSMTPLKPKMKSRIPQLFWLKLRYGMGIFPYEIILRDIPSKNKSWAKNEDLKFQRGH
jgi:hypothetical protein